MSRILNSVQVFVPETLALAGAGPLAGLLLGIAGRAGFLAVLRPGSGLFFGPGVRLAEHLPDLKKIALVIGSGLVPLPCLGEEGDSLRKFLRLGRIGIN